MSIISIIAAIDENNAIGKDGQLLCRLSSDLSRFKTITSGHSIIMGRKTFDSLPNGALPNRRNIVISRSLGTVHDDCEVVDSLQKAISLCADEDEIFIIGGGEIYRQAIDLVDKLYITYIHHKFVGADTFFPIIQSDKWMNSFREEYISCEGDEYPYTFKEYIRVSEKKI